MATCIAQDLLTAGKCFSCLTKKELQIVIAQLLCEIVDGEDGGAGSVFSGHYGGGAPTDVPTTSAAVAYDLDSPFNFWTWNGSAWG